MTRHAGTGSANPLSKSAEPNELEQIADQAAGAVGDDDGAGLGSLLDTGGEIGCFPGHRFLFRSAFAEQVAHDHQAGGNADARLQQVSVDPRHHAADRLGHREASPDGSLRRVFACPRPAEVSQNAVSQEFRDVAFQSRNFPCHRVLVGAHDIAQLFGIDPSAEIGRADEVDEHERQLAALSRWGRPNRRRSCRRDADGIENLPPVTNGPDADLLEILSGQVRQDLKIDAVVLEHLLIGLQAEAAQPLSDVQVRLRSCFRLPLLSLVTLPVAVRMAGRSGSAGTGCPDRTWPSAP